MSTIPKPINSKSADWPWHDFAESEYSDSEQVISIIVPTFNHGDSIEETLRSIFLQNHKRKQVIVIDGGSQDDTVEILEHYVQA